MNYPIGTKVMFKANIYNTSIIVTGEVIKIEQRSLLSKPTIKQKVYTVVDNRGMQYQVLQEDLEAVDDSDLHH